jgi:hypothetical protein
MSIGSAPHFLTVAKADSRSAFFVGNP